MKILALDTTGTVASVALMEETKIVAEITSNHLKNHSQTIMPMVKHVLEMGDCSIKDVDYIACSQGPGSFTGLRIGAATAKALAHGAGKKIVPVPTLDALAYNIYNTASIIVPIMDARRNQVYTAFYKWENERIILKKEYMAEDIQTVLEMLKEYNSQVIFTGDGVLNFKEDIREKGFGIAPFQMNMQRAASVGALGFILAEEGKVSDYTDFTPFYIRKPQAEREYEEKNCHD